MRAIFAILVLLSAVVASVSCAPDGDTMHRDERNFAKQRQMQETTSPFQFLRNTFGSALSLFDCFGGTGGDENSDEDDNADGGGSTKPPSEFSITLDLQGVSNTNEFQNAMDRWSQIIVGDIPDFSGNLDGGSSCGDWPSSIDDVYICGVYKYIDGPGGVLGSASPRHYRPTEGLPLTGEMSFEIIDIQQGRIKDLLGVILHEIGHVLGIGSLWTINGLIDNFDLPCLYKADSQASREYQRISGCSGTIPLEQSMPGSNCVHWAEGCFLNEVMTSAANTNLPVSRLTLAGLEDLGYDVDYSQAESFTAVDLNPSCVCNNRLRRTQFDGDNTLSTVETSSSNGHKRRKLSTAGNQYATEYGQSILAKNREQISLLPESDVPDIGGDVVYVIYLEEDTVYNVLVTSD